MGDLRKSVRETMDCDPSCNHGLNAEACFEHQIDKVIALFVSEMEKLIEEAPSIYSDVTESEYVSEHFLRTSLKEWGRS